MESVHVSDLNYLADEYPLELDTLMTLMLQHFRNLQALRTSLFRHLCHRNRRTFISMAILDRWSWYCEREFTSMSDDGTINFIFLGVIDRILWCFRVSSK